MLFQCAGLHIKINVAFLLAVKLQLTEGEAWGGLLAAHTFCVLAPAVR